MKNSKDCEICYKIKCKRCGWEANEEETLQIQKGVLTACPQCGWQPN